MKKCMKFLFIAVGFMTLSVHALSADLLDTVTQRHTLKVGMEGTYPPFNFKDKSQQLAGFEVELSNELAKRMNLKAEFTTGEWSGLLAGLQAGKYDVVINQVSITDKRKEIFDFSKPYTISSAQLIVRQDETRAFNRLEDLKGHKLGATQGSNFADMVKAVAGIDLKTYPGAAEAMQDLATGRIDAALNDRLLIPTSIKEAKLPLKAGGTVGTLTYMGIPFAKGNPKFQAALDQALDSMRNDGTLAKISNKWFKFDVSQVQK